MLGQKGSAQAMAERFEFTLGSVEATIVGQALDVDVRRFPLRIRNSSIDPVRFAKVAVQVYRDLESRRLSVGGELVEPVRTAFGLLGKSHVSVAISGIDDRGGDIAVLSATDGSQALAITQSPGEDELWFNLFSDDKLVDILAGALPSARPASTGTHRVEQRAQRSVSAMTARRLAEAEEDEEETDAFGNIQLMGVVRPRAGVNARESGADIGVLERVMTGERLGGGYIVATGTGRHGEHLTAQPLSWLDTEDGRYLVRTADGDQGATAAEYVPAGFTDVSKAIRQVISSIY
jgi:hypothetical protein